MEKSVFFSARSEPENLALAKKTFILSLILTGIYLVVGFKWFYSLLFSTLNEWQFYFAWPLYRFAIATCLFFLVPWYAWCKKWGQPVADLGWQWGKWKIGLILAAIGGVIVLGTGVFTGADPSFKQVYPQWRVFVDPHFGPFNPAGFVVMEVLYIITYYIPYEFFFRGFSQFPLVSKGNVRTTWVVIYTTLITTAVHYDVPTFELTSAFLFGFLLGFVAIKLKSFRYGLFVHAETGLVNDFVCLFLLQGWS